MMETIKTTKNIDGVEVIDRDNLTRFEKGELLNTTAGIAVFNSVLNPYVFESAFKIATALLFSDIELDELNTVEGELKIDNVFEIIKLQLNKVDFTELEKQALEVCQKTAEYHLSFGASIDVLIDKANSFFDALGINLEQLMEQFANSAKHLQENDYTSVVELAKKYGLDTHQTN